MHVAYVGKLAKIFLCGFRGVVWKGVARDRVDRLKTFAKKKISTNFSSSWEKRDASPKNIACWLETNLKKIFKLLLRKTWKNISLWFLGKIVCVCWVREPVPRLGLERFKHLMLVGKRPWQALYLHHYEIWGIKEMFRFEQWVWVVGSQERVRGEGVWLVNWMMRSFQVWCCIAKK